MVQLRLPDGVLGMAARAPEWADWVGRLPRLTAGLLTEWELEPDGLPMHGYVSLVVPVITSERGKAVLKISFDGDDESEHEGLALQHWEGRGAVQLLRADPRRRALLLERLGPDTLDVLDDLAACEIVAGLYGRLHRPAFPQLRPLTAYVATWLDDLAALGRDLPVPPRMVDQALHLGRALAADPASTGVVIHGDLHYRNVLSGAREPWLAIDPKPMSGDPHYEPPPMLWNRWQELSGDLRSGIRRRFHTLVDVAGLDEDRARDWTIVRMVVDASWTALDARRAGRALHDAEREWITRCVAIVKAVQDY